MNNLIKKSIAVLATTVTLFSSFSESFATSVSVSDTSNANMQIVTNASTTLSGLNRKAGESITAYLKNATPFFSDGLNSNTAGWVQQAGTLSVLNGYLFLGIAGNQRNSVSSVATVQTPIAMTSNNFHAHFVVKPIDGIGAQFMIGASAPNASFCSNAGGYGIQFGTEKTSLYRNGCTEVASYTNSATFSTNGFDPISVDFIKQGTTIRVIANGTTIISYTDASPLTISAANRYIALGASNSALMLSDLRIVNPTSVVYTQYPTANTVSVVTETLPLGANPIVVQNGGGANSSPMATGLRHAYDFETLYTSGGIQYASDLAGSTDARIPSRMSAVYGNIGMGVHSDFALINYTSIEKGIRIPDSSMPTTNYTMTARVATMNTAVASAIMAKETTSAGISYQSSGVIGISQPMILNFWRTTGGVLSASGTANTPTSATNGNKDGQWHSYTIRVSSVTGTDYFVDGIKMYHTAVTADDVATENIYFGWALNRSLAGDIDEARVYSRALSDSEILADQFERGLKNPKNYIVYVDSAPSAVTGFAVSYTGTTNSEIMSWSSANTLTFDGSGALDSLITSGKKSIDYNDSKNGFAILSDATPTQFYRADNAINLKSVVGIPSAIDVAANGDEYYTLTAGGGITRYGSGGITLATVTLAGYQRIVYTSSFSASAGAALVAVSTTGYAVLNPSSLATISTGTFNGMFGISGTVVDAFVRDSHFFVLDSANTLSIADINRSKLVATYSVSIGGATPYRMASNGVELFISGTDGNIYFVSFPTKYEILRNSTTLVGTSYGTGFTDNIGDGTTPGLATLNAGSTTINGNGYLTSLVINAPTVAPNNVNYNVRSVSPGGSTNINAAVGVSIASPITGYEVMWKSTNTILENTTPRVNVTSTTIPVPAIPNGVYYAHVRAMNSLGVWGSTTVIGPYTLNGTPPSITNMTISNRGYSSGTTINIMFDSDSQLNTSVTTVVVNGITLGGTITETPKTGSGYTYSTPFTPADETSRNYVIINATDLGGLVTKASFDFGKVSGWVQVLGSVASNNGVILSDNTNQRSRGILGEISAPSVVGLDSSSNTIVQRGDNFEPFPTTASGARNVIDFRSVYGNAPKNTTLLAGGIISGNVEFMNGFVYQYTASDDTQAHCLHIGSATTPLSFRGQGTISVNGSICIDGDITVDKTYDSDHYSSALDINATGNIYISPKAKKAAAGVLIKANGTVYTGTNG